MTRRTPQTPRLAAAPLLLAVAAAVPGCGDGAGAGVRVVDPWVRAPVPAGDGGAVNAAAYFALENAGPAADVLVAVETAVADTAELHRATLDDGITRMRPVDAVPVPARGAAALEPGGHHVMLVGLRRELAAGDTVMLVLRLRSGRALDVRAPVLRSR